MVALAATAAQQPTAQQPPPQAQQQQSQQDRHLIALILAAFAAWHTAGQIVAALRGPFRAAGISTRALEAGVQLVLLMPQSPLQGTGPASRFAIRQNINRRAAFTLASVRRIEKAAQDAKARGESVADAIQRQVALERNWFSAHIAASYRRTAAGSSVDGAADAWGDLETQAVAVKGCPTPDRIRPAGILLGWHAILDEATTPGCRHAHKKNFYADDPPIVENLPAIPGAVHPRCRCSPVRPWPGAPILPSAYGPKR